MVESPAQSGRLKTLIHPGPVAGVHVIFIEDTQEFQPTIIRYLIELSVDRSYVMWVLGSQPLVGTL
jgi:hypothetical protein